ncbi:helix-turn-helix domain-containing protein [Lacticaseibacillus thailandensis]|nr:helix-turn-helix transcriptional regulator [Lacticaseibacillus thailandensis]
MAVDFEAVGRYIEELRLAKHIPRHRLAQDLGWSQKTLQRIAQGQVDMKLSQFIHLLSYLTAEPEEVDGLVEGHTWSFDQVDGHIINAGATGDTKQLEATKAELTAAMKKEYLPWMKSEILTCDIMLCELRGDDDGAHQAANRLFHQLANYEQWTAFDFRVVSRVVSYVPYAELRDTFKGHELNERALGWTRLDDQADAVLDSFYIGLIDSAVDSGKVDNVLEVCDLIRQRVVLWSNYYFRMYKRLCVAIVELLTGDQQQAVKMKDDLLASVGGFIPHNIFQRDHDGIEQLWRNVERLRAGATE